MPPRIVADKSSKILKENLGIVGKAKLKTSAKVTRPTRKALADKTNSASDDNGSLEVPNKANKNSHSSVKPAKIPLENDKLIKPRREKRLPNRFNDYDIITIVSKNAVSIEDDSSQSPFKAPQKASETSLVVTRPQRVSRLPSRFEDHSMSPSKFIPVQPFHASTPIAQKSGKPQEAKNTLKESSEKVSRQKKIKASKEDKHVTKIEEPKESLKTTEQNKNTSSDSNNNTKGRTLRSRQNAQRQNEAKTQKRPSKTSTKVAPRIPKIPVKNSKKQNELKTQKNTAKPPAKVTPRTPESSVRRVKISKKQNEMKTRESPTKTPAIGTPRKPDSPVQKAKKVVSSKISPVKKSRQKIQSPVKAATIYSRTKSPIEKSPAKRAIQRPLIKDFSFKILEDNKKNESNQDVYEFTFDPNEEPAPQKKKKKVVRRKPVKTKPKTVVFKCNYDDNVNKTLTALKNVVAKKPTQDTDAQKQTKVPQIQVNGAEVKSIDDNTTEQTLQCVNNVPQIQRNIASKIIIGNTSKPVPASTNINASENIHIQQNVVIYSPTQQNGILNMNNSTMTGLIDSANAIKLPDHSRSTRVEDIEADFEPDLNYSPVYSPARPETPVAQICRTSVPYNNDPLNLRDNSFFEQIPVASSSMNMSISAHQPQPSPWRVEFENLPLRWHVNSYVKPNMTPAVECSFVSFENKNKNKHVYTNLVPESNNTLPEIVENNQPNMIQTSMFEFIRQQVEKSSAKKNRGRSVTPVTASLFIDTSNKTPNKDAEKVAKSTRQLFTPNKNVKPAETEPVDSNTSEDKGNSMDSSKGRKRKNEEIAENAPPKTPRKEKDNTYFGFDESENMDQENVSPKKRVDGRKRAVRHRARAALKEINNQGPTRGVIPIAAKTALNSEVERLYNEMKSASDAPVFPEKELPNMGTTNVCEPLAETSEDSEQSVHLFEDIEDIVHHIKPQRKSYGKAKKVTFRQVSSDSNTQDEVARPESDHSDADDDMDDLTFDPGVPFEEEKKKKKAKKLTKKQKMSKKEEAEAEAWAADFNSMCEDVEDFPLVIE